MRDHTDRLPALQGRDLEEQTNHRPSLARRRYLTTEGQGMRDLVLPAISSRAGQHQSQTVPNLPTVAQTDSHSGINSPVYLPAITPHQTKNDIGHRRFSYMNNEVPNQPAISQTDSQPSMNTRVYLPPITPHQTNRDIGQRAFNNVIYEVPKLPVLDLSGLISPEDSSPPTTHQTNRDVEQRSFISSSSDEEITSDHEIPKTHVPKPPTEPPKGRKDFTLPHMYVPRPPSGVPQGTGIHSFASKRVKRIAEKLCMEKETRIHLLKGQIEDEKFLDHLTSYQTEIEQETEERVAQMDEVKSQNPELYILYNQTKRDMVEKEQRFQAMKYNRRRLEEACNKLKAMLDQPTAADTGNNDENKPGVVKPKVSARSESPFQFIKRKTMKFINRLKGRNRVAPSDND